MIFRIAGGAFLASVLAVVGVPIRWRPLAPGALRLRVPQPGARGGRLRVDGVRTEPDATDDRTYNTKGQRVRTDRPVAPGLYIRQGRKYVVK